MNRARRGYSLIELLVVLSILGTIWATMVLALHTLYRTDAKLRDELNQAHSLDRFIAQLRLDAHDSMTAAITDDGDAATTLTLSNGESQSIQYSISNDGIERLVRDGDTINHRESYHLPGITHATWNGPEADSRLMKLRLEITHSRKTAIRTHEITTALQAIPSTEVSNP